MIQLDGDRGEGGGQLLRTALTVSVALGRPFRMSGIRGSRDPPGLRSQHLAAVRAAGRISDAAVEGDDPGSREIRFRPGSVRAGAYDFETGSAGSAILVLQTVLPPLLRVGGASTVTVDGGTHNPFAPPYEFLERAYLPFLNRAADRARTRLVRPGFFPAGGGRVTTTLRPGSAAPPLELLRRGRVSNRSARAIVSDLPRHIAEREVATAHAYLDLRPDATEVVEVRDPRGPGNAIMIELEMSSHTEVFTGFGRRGTPAEEVALEACRAADAFLDTDAPVAPHLGDQLLVPLALEQGGRYRVSDVTSHARTNADLLREFAGARIDLPAGPGPGEIRVAP